MTTYSVLFEFWFCNNISLSLSLNINTLTHISNYLFFFFFFHLPSITGCTFSGISFVNPRNYLTNQCTKPVNNAVSTLILNILPLFSNGNCSSIMKHIINWEGKKKEQQFLKNFFNVPKQNILFALYFIGLTYFFSSVSKFCHLSRVRVQSYFFFSSMNIQCASQS